MADLADKSQLLNYLKLHNLWAKKGLSQNFLVDRDSLDKIVAAAELRADDFVVEIGPGVGTLTQELVDKAGKVASIEMDQQLAEILSQDESPNLRVINSDILKVNLDEVIGDQKYKVVANIPYHITSKILELFLSRKSKPESIVLLVQKEVAERVCARPGDMSVLSVSVQLYGRPQMVAIVPKESFFPAPKVDSAILKIVIGHERFHMRKDDEKDFFRCVHIGFAARRKTLANNLMAGYHLDREGVIDILTLVGLKESVRAQELDISNWRDLCQELNRGARG